MVSEPLLPGWRREMEKAMERERGARSGEEEQGGARRSENKLGRTLCTLQYCNASGPVISIRSVPDCNVTLC